MLSLSARPPPYWGCPACGFAYLFPLCAPVVSGVSCFPAPGALGLGVLCPLPLSCLFFPSLLFCAPLVSGVPCFWALGALRPGVLCPPPPPPSWCFFSSSSAHSLFPAFRVFRPWVPWALASCAPPPPPSLLFFFPFFPCCGLPVVRCCGAAVLSVLGSGACWCVLLGAWASVGASVLLRSILRCPLPVPFPFVLLPVVLRVPRGAVLAPLLSPVLPLLFASRAPPPPPRLWCPLLCFVVPRAVWRHGLSCVLCCARWCVGCLCRLGSCAVLFGAVLCQAVLCFFCPVLLPRAVAFSAGSGLRAGSGCFCFCALLVRCCAGVPASLLSVWCSLALAALAGVLCFCLLCLRVC